MDHQWGQVLYSDIPLPPFSGWPYFVVMQDLTPLSLMGVWHSGGKFNARPSRML